MKNFIVLKEYFIKNKWKYFFGVIALLFVDIIQLIIPQIIRTFTNLLQNNKLSVSQTLRFAFYLLLTGIGIGIGRFLWRILIIGASRKLEYNLRNKLFNHLQKLSSNYFNNHKTGDLMAHATNDINAVRMALGPGVIMMTDAVFITITAISFMIKTANLKLTLLALIPLPFLSFIVLKFGTMLHNRYKSVQESFSDLTDKVQENFAGVRVVKSFVQETSEIEKFKKSNEHNFNMKLRLVKIMGMFFPLIQFISAISFLIVIWYGGTLVINGNITLGDFIAFNLYMDLLVWPMMAIGRVINILQMGSASMERINVILNEKPEIHDDNNILNKFNIDGCIEFKNVSFKYKNSNVYALKNINIDIPKGKTLAIVGRTGSGKTTLVNLLLRLYNIDEGKILVDGVELSKISLKTLRENIGYVPQDSFLFSTTIKNNIALAFDDEISDEKVETAAKIAQVYDNVIEFPDKFKTILGERGVTLSGGQKQRISIARSIIKYPSVLILDDSLSAVDTHTEEKILEGLDSIMKSRTTILIAHRISTLKNADEIIVLDEGKIIERGSHEELITIKGIYNDIYEKQLLEEKIEKI